MASVTGRRRHRCVLVLGTCHAGREEAAAGDSACDEDQQLQDVASVVSRALLASHASSSSSSSSSSSPSYSLSQPECLRTSVALGVVVSRAPHARTLCSPVWWKLGKARCVTAVQCSSDEVVAPLVKEALENGEDHRSTLLAFRRLRMLLDVRPGLDGVEGDSKLCIVWISSSATAVLPDDKLVGLPVYGLIRDYRPDEFCVLTPAQLDDGESAAAAHVVSPLLLSPSGSRSDERDAHVRWSQALLGCSASVVPGWHPFFRWLRSSSIPQTAAVLRCCLDPWLSLGSWCCTLRIDHEEVHGLQLVPSEGNGNKGDGAIGSAPSSSSLCGGRPCFPTPLDRLEALYVCNVECVPCHLWGHHQLLVQQSFSGSDAPFPSAVSALTDSLKGFGLSFHSPGRPENGTSRGVSSGLVLQIGRRGLGTESSMGADNAPTRAPLWILYYDHCVDSVVLRSLTDLTTMSKTGLTMLLIVGRSLQRQGEEARNSDEKEREDSKDEEDLSERLVSWCRERQRSDLLHWTEQQSPQPDRDEEAQSLRRGSVELASLTLSAVPRPLPVPASAGELCALFDSDTGRALRVSPLSSALTLPRNALLATTKRQERRSPSCSPPSPPLPKLSDAQRAAHAKAGLSVDFLPASGMADEPLGESHTDRTFPIFKTYQLPEEDSAAADFSSCPLAKRQRLAPPHKWARIGRMLIEMTQDLPRGTAALPGLEPCLDVREQGERAERLLEQLQRRCVLRESDSLLHPQALPVSGSPSPQPRMELHTNNHRSLSWSSVASGLREPEPLVLPSADRGERGHTKDSLKRQLSSTASVVSHPNSKAGRGHTLSRAARAAVVTAAAAASSSAAAATSATSANPQSSGKSKQKQAQREEAAAVRAATRQSQSYNQRQQQCEDSADSTPEARNKRALSKIVKAELLITLPRKHLRFEEVHRQLYKVLKILASAQFAFSTNFVSTDDLSEFVKREVPSLLRRFLPLHELLAARGTSDSEASS